MHHSSRLSHIMFPAYLFILMATGCKLLPQKTVFSNFEKERSKVGYGVVEHRGIQFWLQAGERDPVDRLELVPGRYMIGFVVRRNGRSGAGMCNIEADKFYSFQVRDRQYLPKSGIYAITGTCVLTDKGIVEESEPGSGANL